MLTECAGAWVSANGPSPEYSYENQQAYLEQMWSRVSEEHPEVWMVVNGGSSVSAFFRTEVRVLANDGLNPSPFAEADLWESIMAFPEQFAFETTFCEGYVFSFDGTLVENTDGDGVLVGEAHIFYEVGGLQSLMLDGDLKEVHFTFPPDQTATSSSPVWYIAPGLLEAVEAAASEDCLAVFPAHADEEQLNFWMSQHLDNLFLEGLGRERAPQEYPTVFTLPPRTQPECVILFHRDAASGESVLIYDTEAGIVKVPFEIPSLP